MVTGATGCVGSALVDQLVAAGHQVNILVRSSSDVLPFQSHPNVRVFVGDLFHQVTLNQATVGAESVFHLAAKVHSHPKFREEKEEVFRVNVEGTKNLLAACTANKVARFVFFSTVAVMADQPEPSDENTPCAPTTPYAQSKYEAEGVVLQHQREHGLFVSILRLPLVYGPRDRGNVGRLIEAILRKRYFIIGSGKNIKTVLYSENAAAAALHVIKFERAKGQVYIVSDAATLNLTEISQAIAEEVGVALPRPHIPRVLALGLGTICDWVKRVGGPSLPVSCDRVEKLTSHVHCISEKIKRELDFHPPISFQEGLSRTTKWHKIMREENLASAVPPSLRYHL